MFDCVYLSVMSTVSADFVIGTFFTLSDFSSLLPLADVVAGFCLRLGNFTACEDVELDKFLFCEDGGH